MKNLYLILRKKSDQAHFKTSFELLRNSAEMRKIQVQSIFTEKFDFSKQANLTHHDGLYNLCDDINSQLIEKSIINSKVQTFYSHYKYGINKVGDVDDVRSYCIHNNNNLPVMKTILSLPNNKAMLKKYVNYLEGFPIIIKSTGGSHGIGVMKIDSMESLRSIVDYLRQQKDNFIMRKFIDYTKHARFIVLGNTVIASIEYKRLKNDFRSNVGNKLNIVAQSFGAPIEKIAVDAVRLLGYEFGGVDILIDEYHKPHIAEVNFPCYFPRAQEATGVDISGQMIDYLINKSKDNIATR